MADPISAAIMTFAATVGSAASSAAAFVGFSAATATAIGATVGSFTMGALSLGAIGGGLAATLGGLAATAGINALMKPKIPDQYAQLNAKRSSIADRTMLAGRVAVGGFMATDSMVHGTNGRLVSFVCFLSGAGTCGVVEKIIYGDDEITFNSDGTAIGAYNGKIHLFQRSGSWSQTANSIAGGTLSGAYDAPPDWTSNDKLLGCMNALVIIDAGDDKIKADGIKQPIFVVNANQTPLIDPRTGSAATTQAQFENPFVWAYSWARSLFQATPSGLVIAGLAIASAGVHTASFADAANFADTNGFKISAEINLNPNNAWENLRAISQAGGGDVTTRNGQLYCTTASPKSIVGIITDDDCTTKPTRKALNAAHDRPNRIIPRYRSETNKWEIIDGSPITSSAFVTADGGKVRTASEYFLPFAGGGATPIGKLAALALVNAREPWQYNVSLKPQARYLGFVGDCVQLDIARLGWTGKKVLIGEMQSTIGLATSIVAVSETDSKYPWALGQSTTPPDYYTNSRFDARNVAQPASGKWSATAVQITSGGTSLPIIRVTGDALDFADCTGVIIEYKPNSGSVWQMAGDLPRTTTACEINEVTPNTLYNIRVSYKGKGGFIGLPRDLSDVDTGDFVAGEAASVPWSGVTNDNGNRPADNATRNNTFNGLLSNRPVGGDGDFYYATDTKILYQKIGGIWTTGANAFDSLALLDATANAKLSGIEANATRNTITAGLAANRPTGADGDTFLETDGDKLVWVKSGGSWVQNYNAKTQVDGINTTLSVNGLNSGTNIVARMVNVEANKAEASTVSTLSGRVGTAESNITSLNSVRVDQSGGQTIVDARADSRITATFGGNMSGYKSIIDAAISTNSSQATQITNLTAKVSAGQLQNPNAGFDQWRTDWPNVPLHWTDWGWAVAICSKVDDGNGGTGVRMSSIYNDAGIVQNAQVGKLTPNTWIVLELELIKSSGSFVGTGMRCEFYGDGGVYKTAVDVRPDQVVDAYGASVGGGLNNKTYTFSKLLKTGSDWTEVIIYAMNNWSNYSTAAVVKDITWLKCGWRNATQAEIRANKASTDIPIIQASVTTAQSAIATIEGAAAYYNLEVAASGSTPALMSAKAGKNGSSFDFISKVFRIWNATSTGIIEVLKAVGGYVFFSNPISIDVGTKRLTLGANSAHVLWFGANTIDPPAQTTANSIFSLGTNGKIYYGGSDIATALNSLSVIGSAVFVSGSRSGAGTATTASVTATASGGVSPYTYAWTRLSGDNATSANSPSSATTTFSAYLPSTGLIKSSQFICVVTDSAGSKAYLNIGVELEN